MVTEWNYSITLTKKVVLKLAEPKWIFHKLIHFLPVEVLEKELKPCKIKKRYFTSVSGFDNHYCRTDPIQLYVWARLSKVAGCWQKSPCTLWSQLAIQLSYSYDSLQKDGKISHLLQQNAVFFKTLWQACYITMKAARWCNDLI